MAEGGSVTVVPPGSDAGRKAGVKVKKGRASTITRIFGHLMDVGGGFEAGTWNIGMLFLDSAPEEGKLREMVEDKLFTMSRYRSKLVVNRRGGHFEEIPLEEIDWDYHLGYAFQHEEVDLDQVVEYIGGFYEYGMDINKPLWKFILVPNMNDGRACLIAIINHGIGDGVSTIGSLLNILDDPPIDPTKSMKEQAEAVPAKRKKKPEVSLFSRIGMFFHGVREGLLGAYGSMDKTSILKPVRKAQWTANKKLLALGDQISLDRIKEVKSKFPDATVNDVLIAMLTMTVRSFLEEKGDSSAGKKNSMRGNFPVSMKTSNDPLLPNSNPNNDWAPVEFRFPFDYKDGVDCMYKVKQRLDKLKVSPQTIVTRKNTAVMLNILPRKYLIEKVVQLNAKATAMLSNVPGPSKKVHIAGRGIDDIMFFLFSPLSVYIGILSYNNKVSIGVNFGEELKLDPKDLAKHWKEQFESLHAEVMGYEGQIAKNPKQRKKVSSV